MNVVWLLALLSGCSSTLLTGRVFIDANRDGIRQSSERGAPNVTVGFDRTTFTKTTGKGEFLLASPRQAGFVWVRVPDGFRPEPVSAWIADGDQVDLPLVPLSARELASPVSFVVAADSHVTADATGQDPWDPVGLADAIDQAVSLEEPPRFFTIVGDMTQGNRAEEFQRLGDALATTSVPWIPVAGNHDWYDGGNAYRWAYGTDNYSFEISGIHFIVWDTNLSESDQIEFVEAELADVPDATVVVAMGHESPSDEVAEAMAAAGVDYMFTGHWHANRRVQRGPMVEWGTQTFLMGSIDQAPAGYRVVTFADGVPIVTHRERLVESHLEVVAPHIGSCASPTGFSIIAAAALDASRAEVNARIDCGEALPLVDVGGWSYESRAPALPAGAHTLTVTATSPSGRSLTRHIGFEVCTQSASASSWTAWPQHGGGPTHTHATSVPVESPLGVRWTATVGGTISLGSPAIMDGLAVVALTDFGSGDEGGIVALDLTTGAERWRYVTPFPAVASPAIADGMVVVTTKNGEVHAVSLADGELQWRYAVGGSSLKASLWAPPTIAEGLVYVATQGNFIALELSTGEPVWARDPEDPELAWLGSLAAVAVTDGSALAAFNRTLGLQSWSAATGISQWAITDGRASAINAAPVVGDGVVYIVNAAGLVSAIDLTSRFTRWTMQVTPMANDWDYSVTATPALANGRLFVATQRGELIALDAATGTVLWRVNGSIGPVNYTHYRDSSPGFPASPLVTGDVVWIGTLAGELLALDVADGNQRWSTQLGAPIASSPVPTGDALVIATYDGSVRLLAPAPEVSMGPTAECAPLDPVRDQATSSGCTVGGSSNGGALLLALSLLRLVRRRPRR